ncbi:Similar to similar to An06g00150 [Aspergillus kawachii IFO 4308]; acc. no. GAA88098 [Pyronema omphalodes CBS 100304]|uniref:Similar to similar to An06g00150 [Aspergillus kawachii IFO 4308] acc. no. GAA88098 n=1 Tax=Pyronema omphalodes (strain CBS 100304) TaxID=1076935 RepID=U4L9I8_PYROM|nr:Similar to similar to An06g00150 [Aspergillus kawachii IFO 4308]; acc. no. GAA88098 [Pyronema omphalodes CBS 100304]
MQSPCIFRDAVSYIFTRASDDAPTKPNLPPMTSTPPPVPAYRFRYFLTNLTSLLISASCLIIIATTLNFYTNSELPIWGDSITIHSFTAWLSAIAKLALVIPLAECISQAKFRLFAQQRRKLSDLDLADAASRNPLGALGWLLRFRSGLLLHFGAALVVVSLAWDPAMQHLIRPTLSSIPDRNATASLAINGDYAPQRGLDRGLVLTTPKAISAGILAAVLGQSITPSYYCPSGNCTYPPVSTVGICTSCEDITASLIRSCKDLSQKDPYCIPGSDACYTTGQLCSYRSASGVTIGGANGIFLNFAAAGADFVNVGNGNIELTRDIVNLTALYSDPRGAADPPDNGTFAASPIPMAPGHVKSGVHKARGYQCKITYCQQQVQSFVIGGQLKEILQPATDSVESFMMKRPVLNSPDLPESVLQHRLNLTRRKDSTRVSLTALYALSKGLSVSLSGNTTYAAIRDNAPAMSDFHRAFYERMVATSFMAMMGGISNSMTSAIRNEMASSAAGTVWVQRHLLRIKWEWIILPSVIWIGVLIMLLTTTFRARKEHAPWLGTSQLATVYIDLEREVRVDVDRRDAAWGDKGMMRTVAEGQRVRIAPVYGIDGSARLEFTRLEAPAP